jgi:hypothetical protein
MSISKTLNLFSPDVLGSLSRQLNRIRIQWPVEVAKL